MDVTYKVLVGDCIEQMRTLPDESVHMIATSPPYWGLRDYGCDGQIGLEQTPEEFVARLVDVFREARRVLRSDGVCWVNLGDSYNAYNGGAGPSSSLSRGAQTSERPELPSGYGLRNKELKPKDLVGIPWRVAFALQADGWWLRQDVIWAKPNPMPESVTDRCTKAHEYVFLLAKSERYFYDSESIKEGGTNRPCENTKPTKAGSSGDEKHRTAANLHRIEAAATRNRRSVWKVTEEELEQFRQWKNAQEQRKPDVWTIATAPYKEAHFATWPPKLVEPMIRAGTSEKGCCAACGAQWVRVVERVEQKTYEYQQVGIPGESSNRGRRTASCGSSQFAATGWQPSCQCNAGETVPCTVLDPFGGSGTTLGVANALGRHGIACELNPEYAALMPARVRSIVDAYYGRESAPSIEPGEGQLSLFE